MARFHRMDFLHRMWVKMLLRKVHFDEFTSMFRVKSRFSQITQTGRIMCAGPNLQSVPKSSLVRCFLLHGFKFIGSLDFNVLSTIENNDLGILACRKNVFTGRNHKYSPIIL